MTNHPKFTQSHDSAPRSIGYEVATEIRILDRNGNEHQSCQTCPGCSADYYDTNFENCPVCGHGMVYDLGS